MHEKKCRACRTARRYNIPIPKQPTSPVSSIDEPQRSYEQHPLRESLRHQPQPESQSSPTPAHNHLRVDHRRVGGKYHLPHDARRRPHLDPKATLRSRTGTRRWFWYARLKVWTRIWIWKGGSACWPAKREGMSCLLKRRRLQASS